jgi:CDP-glucose 4,6-dehydratase
LVEEGISFAEAWNFGPPEVDAVAVKWIVDEMVKHWGDGAAWARSPARQPHETECLKLDASKAIERLGWRPRTNLATGLKLTAQWYKAWVRGEDVRRISAEQIEGFIDASDGG